MFENSKKMSNLIRLIEDGKFEKKFYSNYKRLKIRDATIHGIAANSKFLFVADNRSQYLSVFDKDGNFVKFSEPQNVRLKSSYPMHINFSDVSANEDNVVASDRGNHSICKYDCEGNLVDIVNSHTPTECIEIGKDGKIFFLKSGLGSTSEAYLLSEKENIFKGNAINLALDPSGSLYGNDHREIFKLSDQNSEQFNLMKDNEYIVDIAFDNLYFFVSSRGDNNEYINIFMKEKTPILLNSYRLNAKGFPKVNFALVGDNLYVQKGFRRVTKFDILKDDYLVNLENLKKAT